MRARPYLILGAVILLAGCGTLKINIVYDTTPSPADTETQSVFTGTEPTTMTKTPTPPAEAPSTAVPSSSLTASLTPTVGPVPPETAGAIAAGYNHTCALITSGRVKCWGLNDKGQLGDGSLTNRSIPAEVIGLSGGVTAIAAGGSHTCALTGGGVKCWGENQSGQLGDGTHTDSATPVDVAGLSNGVAAITAGGGHTCALMDSGAVQCWGWNDVGQLGDGKNIDRSVPVSVNGLGTKISAITAGYKHTCALTDNGGVKCWGWNGSGQLGDGTNTDRAAPVDVGELGTTVLSLSAGEGHTCVLMQNHAVKCWGDNAFGQLGDNTTRESAFPVQVIGLAIGAIGVSAGSVHTCAVTDAGAQCWGSNLFGQLGNGTEENAYRPVTVVGFALTVTAIATGGNHTCGRTAGGGVRCWGNNAYGQLGDGTTVDRSTPVDAIRINTAAMDCGNADRVA